MFGRVEGRKGLCTLSKVSKTWGSCGNFKSDRRRGTLDGDLERRISRCRSSTRDTWVGCVRGGDFLRGVAFWSIRSSGLLRWFAWQTGAALHMTWHHFSWQAQYFRPHRKIAKRIGTRPSALHSTFHFWTKSCRLHFWCCQLRKKKEVSILLSRFWRCQVQKTEEVSQNCCVFDVVKFENEGSLAE